MVLALAAALIAAVAFGVASLLQAVAARSEQGTRGIDVLLLVRLLRHPAFLAALGLNVVGFGLHFFALRTLPLFLAQAVIASSVAVTAVLSAHVLHSPLGARDRWAVLGVCAGLALLTSAAQDEGRTAAPDVHLPLLAGAVGVALLGVALARLPGEHGVALLGFASGLGFAVVGIAGRIITDLSVLSLVRDPAAYALLFGGATGFLLYATALQRGTLMNATSAMVVGETAGPAIVGAFVLGDRVRPGWLPVAAFALMLAVGASVALIRLETPIQEWRGRDGHSDTDAGDGAAGDSDAGDGAGDSGAGDTDNDTDRHADNGADIDADTEPATGGDATAGTDGRLPAPRGGATAAER